MQKTVLCLMGPTAAGKTDVAVQWVQKYPCDIISVDSALVYKDMNIGTAKPTADVLVKAPHQLIDFLDPAQSYSAADFYQDATNAIEKSFANNRVPLLVGGTMLYYRALQQGLSPLPTADPNIRAQLDALMQAQGLEFLYQQLRECDPIAAANIKPNDKQRIARALEVFQITKKPISELQQTKANIPDYNFVNIGIVPDDRAVLHQRIEKRFDLMLKNGFIDEVAALRQREDLNLSLPSMRAVGYRQVWEYLQGDYDKTTMREKAIAATRQLAKRQITWLRSWPKLQTLETCPIEDYF